MALSATKVIFFICVLTFFSVQIHARESQFFSKVTSSNSNDNYVQESLSKQQQAETYSFVPGTQKTTTLNKQLEPSFIPQTQNGYGLYGQENNRFPTTTSAADVKYKPYTTPITSTPNGKFEPYTTTPTTTTSAAVKYEPYTTPITSTATGTFEPTSTTPTTSYNNKYGFQTEQESLGDSKFQESRYASNNVEKQGMSDTRFYANGKYYHDVKSENNYYPTKYQQQQKSGGYHNGNTYEYNNNPVERYQNEENEFDELP